MKSRISSRTSVDKRWASSTINRQVPPLLKAANSSPCKAASRDGREVAPPGTSNSNSKGLQQLISREPRVNNQRRGKELVCGIPARKHAQQAIENRRLPGTDRTAQEHQPLTADHTMRQPRQRIPMRLGKLQKLRIGRQPERLFPQMVKG